MIKQVYVVVLMVLIPGVCLAQGHVDQRMKTVEYDPTAVVVLEGCRNFQTMVTFADDEHVQNVGVGDASGWQIMPNKRGNLLFVKPIAARSYSNMTVVSDKRSYSFELRNASDSDCSHGRVVYELRFHYAAAAPGGTATDPSKPPADPNAFLPVPAKRNSAYTYVGTAELVPIRIFDDGATTYIKWSAGVSTPAVYALNSDNTESLVNYTSRGDYFVVEQVAPAFIMRRGDEKTILYNDAFVVQGLDALSPRARGKGGTK